MPELSDEEILKLFRNGSNGHYAFNLLVRKYQERIYFTVRRLVLNHNDADDVVQNVFIKVWNHLADFREDSKLFTWIYRITVNESLSFLKSKQVKNFVRFSDTEKELLNNLNDDNFFSGDEVQLLLQKAILKLPSKQRAVFNMRYFDEISYEKMSEIMGTSVGALKASYHFAVKKIEEYIAHN